MDLVDIELRVSCKVTLFFIYGMLAIIYSCYYKHVLQYQFIYSVISSFQLSHQAIYQRIHYLLNELKQKKLTFKFTLKNPNSKLYSTGRRNHMFCSHL